MAPSECRDVFGLYLGREGEGKGLEGARPERWAGGGEFASEW